MLSAVVALLFALAPAEKAACAPGMVKNRNTAGKCCWPAQAWSRSIRRCVGAPECPAGLSPSGDGCRCPGGRELSADTAGHCCWPMQVWSSARKVCVGSPACPAPMVAQGDACVSGPAADAGVVATAGSDEAPSPPPLVEASMPEDWSGLPSTLVSGAADAVVPAASPEPAAAPAADAMEGLTLADTVAWLKQAIPAAASFSFTHSYVDSAGRATESVIGNSITSVEAEGCSLTLKGGRSVGGKPQPEGQGVPEYVWLSNIDPAALRTVRIQDGNFSIVSGGVVTPQVWWVTGSGAQRLVFPDKETAGRVEKALRHAVELCGRK